MIKVENCDGFFGGLTPDGILTAFVTLLTIGGAFLIAHYTAKKQIDNQLEITKEESKRIFKRIEDSFIKAYGTVGLLLNSQNRSYRELVIYSKELEYQIGIIKDSNIINVAPSAIYDDLKKFNEKAGFTLLILQNVILLLEEGKHMKFEEYLLDESLEQTHEQMQVLLDTAEEKHGEMKDIFGEIKKYYS